MCNCGRPCSYEPIETATGDKISVMDEPAYDVLQHVWALLVFAYKISEYGIMVKIMAREIPVSVICLWSDVQCHFDIINYDKCNMQTVISR